MEPVIIHDVGMRDGLQMEKKAVPTEKKIEWINRLFNAGVDIIQAGSFVHPVKVPQMADTDEIFNYYNINGKPGNAVLSGLVLNEKGLDRALDCGVELICMGVSASETHSKKNTGMAVNEATERIIKMAKKAYDKGKSVQVSIQSAFGCGFEGRIDENKVYEIADKYMDAGITNISLADTAGYADPASVERMFSRLHETGPGIQTACHFHNTYGLGLANCYAALKTGVRYFETAFAGLGGCPFTKLPSGNVCTEDFLNLLYLTGRRTDSGINILIDLAKDVSAFFEKELPGYVYKAGKMK